MEVECNFTIASDVTRLFGIRRHTPTSVIYLNFKNGVAQVLIKHFISIAASCLILVISTASLASNLEGRLPAKDCVRADLVLDTSIATKSVAPPFPPLQLDVATPFEPTLFSGGGFNYVIYELNLQSYASDPLALQAVEIFDASRAASKAIATLKGLQLYERMQPLGVDKIDADHPLESGRRAVVFICLAFNADVTAPDKLGHRVLVGDAVAEGPTIGVRSIPLHVLSPPVTGKDWLADNGPSLASHHRTGVFVAAGRARISRRFAIDFKKTKQGLTFSGNARDVHAYYSYGETVFAVADATVVSAKDGFPDNIPKTAAGFNTALPLTMENVGGNAVVLDLGSGQFAYYAHLKPGSVLVSTGDRVQRGQALAQIGNSGDARWPHLHFQVTTSPDILASEGLPYLIDSFGVKDVKGALQTRTREYPIGDIMVDFGATTPDLRR